MRRILPLDRLRMRHHIHNMEELQRACASAGASMSPVDHEHVEISFVRTVYRPVALGCEDDVGEINFNFGEISQGRSARLALLDGLLRCGLFDGWRWSFHRLLWVLGLLLPQVFGAVVSFLDALPMWLTQPLTMLRSMPQQRALRRAEGIRSAPTLAPSNSGAQQNMRRERSAKSRIDKQTATLSERLADGDAERIASALAESVCAFPWKQGDILLIDNKRVLHDGLPGFGPRKLHVALLARTM